MKKKITAGIGLSGAAAAALVLPALVMKPGKLSEEDREKFEHRNFAHRGLHTEDKKVPENSLLAFRLAAEQGYGIELDVQLSKDGQVVVFHDDTLNRVCNVDGRVDAYTYEELHAMKLCGTEETVPLFTDVLKTVNGRGPLVVELKTGPKNNELCEKTLAILQDYRGEYCIESFNPFIVFWFKRHAPWIVRGQLAMLPEKYHGHYNGFISFLLGNCLFTPLNRPQFIAYNIGKKPLSVKLARKLGMMLIAWTPHDRSEEKKNDAMIFEFYRPDLKY